MVKKKAQKSTTQTTEKKEKRAYRKKTQAIPFLPVTEEGHELTPINLKDIPDTMLFLTPAKIPRTRFATTAMFLTWQILIR